MIVLCYFSSYRYKPLFYHSDAASTASDHESEELDTDDDPYPPDAEILGSSPTSMRLYHPKPRVSVQRRATIPGATARPSLSFDRVTIDLYCLDSSL